MPKSLHFFVAVLASLMSVSAVCQTYAFGVLNQRSATLTAEYWNPILAYVGKKVGVTLVLKMGKDAAETDAMTARGEFDFLYSNHIFTLTNAPAGYSVVLRPNEDAIQGQIVVPEMSQLRGIADLRNAEVAFPSPAAFVGYAVPMDHLMRIGVEVKPVFAGNQEGAMAQLKAQKVAAAGVNAQVMRDYARRTGFQYRVLWTSQDYLNLPVAVHPRVPSNVVERIRVVMDAMDDDAAGLAVLKASAEVIGQTPPYGFRRASDRDYLNYRNFYRTTRLKDLQQ